MPIYIYQHPETAEYIEVLQGMNDDHVYFDQQGTEWKRVFTVPNAFTDLESDPFNQNQYLEKTSQGGSQGDLWDRSKELSSKRADKNGGVDPLKKAYFKDYSQKRGGAKHLNDPNK